MTCDTLADFEANSFATMAVDQSDITTEEFELLQVRALTSNIQYYWRVRLGLLQ